MVEQINDITWQAHQGSITAIIQLLNDKLSPYGVRTRAIFSDGVLQILCEAGRVEQLEQSTLVQQIKQTLESIKPRNIRRVNINCRIVREDQLLWLQEIQRDGENQLLWLEEITLSQPNIVKLVIQDLSQAYKSAKPKTQSLLTKKNKRKIPAKKGIIVSAGLFFLVLLLWVINSQNSENKSQILNSGDNQIISTLSKNDPFAEAVRIANQASAAGKTAINSAQWLELAAKWQRASDFMNKVPPTHSRYQEAQIRSKLYKEYSNTAQKEAEK